MEAQTASEGPRYYIDLEGAGTRHRSLPVMIAGRKCYEHRSPESGPGLEDGDAKDHVSAIAKHCSDTADYLLQDTPLKEAIFRVLLAGGNKPMTAQQVSEVLTSRWEMSAYPRDLSPSRVGRLLDHAEGYSISAIPEPEPESEPEDVPPVAEGARPAESDDAAEDVEGAPESDTPEQSTEAPRDG